MGTILGGSIEEAAFFKMSLCEELETAPKRVDIPYEGVPQTVASHPPYNAGGITSVKGYGIWPHGPIVSTEWGT